MSLAFASDILICNKLAGTVAIESAVIGKPVIFLNDYKIKNVWDNIYKKQVKEFDKVENLLDYLLKFKKNKKALLDNHRWNNIINNFSVRSFQKKDYGYRNL